MRVFLLEDDFFIRLKLVDAFVKNGCEVIHVGDTGKDSLAKAVSSYVDLFILDIEVLDDQKAGFKFAKKLYEKDNSIQLVYVTNRKDLRTEAFHTPGYPTPYDFLKKTTLLTEGYNECISELVEKFLAHQPLTIQIENRKIPIDEIMFAEIPYKGILHIYLKNGKFIPLETPLKNLTDSQNKYYIPTLVEIHRSFLANDKFIVNSEKEKTGEAPAILHFQTTKGEIIKRPTGVKEGAKLHKKYRKR